MSSDTDDMKKAYEQADLVQKWAESDEGIDVLTKSAEQIKEFGRKISEESQLDFAAMRQPVTF